LQPDENPRKENYAMYQCPEPKWNKQVAVNGDGPVANINGGWPTGTPQKPGWARPARIVP
jgi:hypothetical protein